MALFPIINMKHCHFYSRVDTVAMIYTCKLHIAGTYIRFRNTPTSANLHDNGVRCTQLYDMINNLTHLYFLPHQTGPGLAE